MPGRERQYYSKMTAKGQITLPTELRRRLGIRPGDLVEVRAEETKAGTVIGVRRRPSLIEATAGIARPRTSYQPPEWDEVENLVRDEVGRRLNEQTDK